MRTIDPKLQGKGPSQAKDWTRTLSYWRTFAADSFDQRARIDVAACVRRISSTDPAWREAICGDAAAASGLVLRLGAPPRICARVDTAMTVLLNTAFENAGAALVLSYALRRMPLDPHERARLAISWLAHNRKAQTCRPIDDRPQTEPGGPRMKLKIQIMSDLHTRYPGASGFPPLAPGAQLVLIGGDTCEGFQRAIRDMRAAYPTADIVTVGGNHEFYGTTYGEELQSARECAKALGVHLLENGTATFGRLRIIGATLWAGYDLFGDSLRQPAMRTAYETMRDHKRIKWRRNPWQRFRPQETRLLHLKSRDYIDAELARPHHGPTIVLTHHAPLLDAVGPKLRNRMIAAAYASDLGPMIDRHQPDCWIWGHTHFSADLRRGRTRLISNPCGYADENLSFDPALTIEVDA